MVKRICSPLKSNSFFIFGARGTGKSTLIHNMLGERALFFDLLDDEVFDRLLVQHQIIQSAIESKKYEWIVIDEIQRLPKLLNLVHRMIEEHHQKFALTGSSSRKLKRGAANLLAGRAFVNVLHPLSSVELGSDFNLQQALCWGTLPKLINLKTTEEKFAYLRSYCLTYIKEEIQAEQIVRKLEPFREFLPIAAQMSGKIINYSTISREVGVQIPTVQTYFQILEETYLGFFLPHFHRSIRKSQIESPKFYIFDNGVRRALEGSLESVPTKGTALFGELFEAFIIQEIFRLNQYYAKDYRLSFFQTKGGAEIDLVLSKSRKTILIEIKSSDRVNEVEVRKLSRLKEKFGASSEAYFLSQDSHDFEIDGVSCLHWQNFLNNFKTKF